MKIKIDKINFHVEIDESNLKGNLTPVVFLHGFTGSSNDWKFIFNKLPQNFLPVAIDLPGHGKTDSPEVINYYSPESTISYLEKIFSRFNFGKIILIGYSMGGRAALLYSLKYSHRIKGLILESTNHGISTEAKRQERIEADAKLADKIETEEIENFVNYWMNIPLFDSQRKLPKKILNKIKEEKLRGSPAGLANSLRGFGTGNMPHTRDQMQNINFPVLLISGEKDEKYSRINGEVVNLYKNAENIIQEDCGHNTHLEKPSEFIILVNNFLQKVN